MGGIVGAKKRGLQKKQDKKRVDMQARRKF